MKLHLAICAAALALVACSKSETLTETETSAAEGGATEKRLPLADCSKVETVDAGAEGWKHPDCRMMLDDKSGLAIEARYTKAEDESTKIAVQVVAPGDATLQTLEETMGNTLNGVTAKDVDADGKVDLLLPLETGNVNTNWAFWRQEEEGRFHRAGELSGVSIERTADGYLAVPSRSSANAWSVGFWRIDAGVLFPVATAEVTAALGANGEPDPGKVTCAVTYDGQTSGIGLSAQEAQAKFCAEPDVAKIFK
jgi:hypothetical protein